MTKVLAGRHTGFAFFIGLPILLVVLAVVIWFWPARTAQDQLIGGIVNDKQPAPNFQLTDQFGQVQKFNSLQGKVVALTFLYTNCPDICPMIATNMHLAYRQLGDDAKRVGMVAVTVDPARDGVEQVRRFSDQRGLTNEWWFLTGNRQQLESVWTAYGIVAQPAAASSSTASAQPSEGIDHSAPIFLIDKHGFVRVLLPVDFQPQDLVKDLRILLEE